MGKAKASVVIPPQSIHLAALDRAHQVSAGFDPDRQGTLGAVRSLSPLRCACSGPTSFEFPKFYRWGTLGHRLPFPPLKTWSVLFEVRMMPARSFTPNQSLKRTPPLRAGSAYLHR